MSKSIGSIFHEFTQHIKDGIKKLKTAGLYKPKNPRAKPTKYAKSLLNKFADVISGNSRAVKVDKKTAAAYKDDTAKAGQARVKGNRVIVPVQPGEKPYYSRKNGTVEVARKLKTGQKYIRTPFKGNVASYDAMKAQLQTHDRIAVAFYRGKKKPVDWHYFSADEFYKEFVAGYGKDNKRGQTALAWALQNSQISRYEESRA
jgi:hypothetical protein